MNFFFLNKQINKISTFHELHMTKILSTFLKFLNLEKEPLKNREQKKRASNN